MRDCFTNVRIRTEALLAKQVAELKEANASRLILATPPDIAGNECEMLT